jgi:hypothetical protein
VHDSRHATPKDTIGDACSARFCREAANDVLQPYSCFMLASVNVGNRHILRLPRHCPSVGSVIPSPRFGGHLTCVVCSQPPSVCPFPREVDVYGLPGVLNIFQTLLDG